ncbi:MAG TPA: MlaD family protein, partial [Planctomycetota bacterium]|nr:MlaD family protein [Planctomycetota bacterium]
MIRNPVNHWKLGLFVVAAVLLFVGSLLVLGAQRFVRATVTRVTYFDETVQGLDVGASVKYRGVTIGQVTGITFAPDRVLVQVDAELYLDVLERIGLSSVDDPIGEDARLPSRNLRLQLSRSGITGITYLEADIFDPQQYPTIELDFAPPPNYIPSVRSTLKGLEQNLAETLVELPGVLRETRGLVGRVREVLDEVDATALQADLGRLLASAQARLDELDLARSGPALAEAEATLVELRALLASLNDPG